MMLSAQLMFVMEVVPSTKLVDNLMETATLFGSLVWSEADYVGY
jgi:hypothetical protein